jgi:hypothetical protein
MLFVTCIVIASALTGYHIQVGKRQAVAIAKIEALGGKPLRTVEREGVFYSGGKIPEPRWKWLHNFLGEEYFVYVPYVDLTDRSVNEDALVEMIPSIETLRLKEGLNEVGKSYIALDVTGNPNLGTEFIEDIRRRLRYCRIISRVASPANSYK